jgi:hypothetical protein
MEDKEYLEKFSNVQIYTDIILGILKYTIVKNNLSENEFLNCLVKKLKFQNTSDIDLLRACIDQIQDAQYAIDNFNKYGLYKQSSDLDEMYLRLYGLLNACYLQIGAIIDLIRLFNFKNQKELKMDLKSLTIIDLRNKIASHTTNYQYIDKQTFGYFRLIQSTLNKWGNRISIVGKERGDVQTFDLKGILNDFTIRIEQILEMIVDKELYSRKFRKDLFHWMELRHIYLKSIK